MIDAIGSCGGGNGVIGGEFVTEGEGEIHAVAEALGGAENQAGADKVCAGGAT